MVGQRCCFILASERFLESNKRGLLHPCLSSVLCEVFKEEALWLREFPRRKFKFQKAMYEKLLPVLHPDDFASTILRRVKKLFLIFSAGFELSLFEDMRRFSLLLLRCLLYLGKIIPLPCDRLKLVTRTTLARTLSLFKCCLCCVVALLMISSWFLPMLCVKVLLLCWQGMMWPNFPQASL